MFSVRSLSLTILALSLAIGFTAVRATAEETKKETGTVSGIIKDKDGKPVSGAEVGVFHPMKKKADKAAKADGTKGEKPVPVVPSVTSDDKGEFKIADVPAGEYTVVARLKGAGNGRENVTVKAGEDTKVEVTVKKQEKKTEAAK